MWNDHGAFYTLSNKKRKNLIKPFAINQLLYSWCPGIWEHFEIESFYYTPDENIKELAQQREIQGIVPHDFSIQAFFLLSIKRETTKKNPLRRNMERETGFAASFLCKVVSQNTTAEVMSLTLLLHFSEVALVVFF